MVAVTPLDFDLTRHDVLEELGARIRDAGI